MTVTETLPVIIIGGGLAGLALAQSLKYQGIPFEVYEKEIENQKNRQGWSMGIHFCLPEFSSTLDPEYYKTLGKSASVKPAHPHEVEFSLVDGKTNEINIRVDPKGFISNDGQEQFLYRVNRKRFRNWLLKDINVHWGKQVDEYIIMNDGVEVTFKDGEKIKGSCLIGADGVRSSICQKILGSEETFNQLTTVNPIYDLVISKWLTNEEYQHIEKLSRTYFMAYAKINRESDMNTTNNNTDDYLVCVASLNDQDFSSDKPHEVIFALSRHDPEYKIPRYDNDTDRLKLFKQWATDAFGGDLLNLILNTQDDVHIAPITIRERYPHVDSLKNHQGRITLIGDAAHAMTMFRGEGANHAILDATLLSKQLVKAYNNEISFYEAIEHYQEEMIPRGTKAVIDSHEAAENAHTSPEKLTKTVKFLMERFKNKENGIEMTE